MKTTCLVAGLALLAACAETQPVPSQAPVSATPAPRPVERVTIALLGTSDLHGYVEARTLSVKGSDGQKHTVRRGGLALLGGYLANIRRHMPTLLLDGGDMFQGTMVSNLGEGRAVVDAYNTLGYQAAALGNHEFDFGPAGPRAVPSETGEDDPNGALKARAVDAHFPFLSSNLLDKKTGQPVTWPNVFPSTKVVINGVPIGIVGAVTEDTPLTTNILNLRDVTVAPVVPAVRAQAEALRQQGVAAVILTIHEGANCSSFDDPRDIRPCENKDERILSIVRQLNGAVDAVVAGHSHAGVAHFVGDVPIIQAFSYGLSFGRVDLTFSKQSGAWQLERGQSRMYPPAELCEVAVPPQGAAAGAATGAPSSLAESAPPPSTAAAGAPGSAEPPRLPASRPPSARCDARVLEGTDLKPAEYDGQPVVPSAEIEAVLKPHLDRAYARANTALGVTLGDRVRRNFRNESPLAQLMADLIRSGASRVVGKPVDVALQNGGGIRNDLPAGPLNYVQVFEVQPFDNRLAVVRLTGAELVEIFRRNYASSHGVLVPSGVKMEGRCVDRQLQLTIRRENGEPIDPKRTYLVAMSDFLASGGDSVGPSSPVPTVPGQPPKVTFFDDVLLRDLIVEELQRYHGPLLSGQLQPLRLGLPAPRPVDCAALAGQTPPAAAAAAGKSPVSH